VPRRVGRDPLTFSRGKARLNRGERVSARAVTSLVVVKMVAMDRLGGAPALLFGLGWRVPRI
jgi:hypothetical protein